MTPISRLAVVEDGGIAGITRPQAPSAKRDLRDPALLRFAREALVARLAPAMLDPFAPAGQRDAEVLKVLRETLGAQLEQGGPLAGAPTDETSLLTLFDETLGWGPAQPYLRDERVQEIKINGDRIMVQESGADFVCVPERFANAQQVIDRALLLADLLNVRIDRNMPQNTLPLGFGSRMHVSIPPRTQEGQALVCIRRGRNQPWQLDDLVVRGSLDGNTSALLTLLCRAGCSFLVCGDTGSGKTALLEALVNNWPGEPHVITIEDNVREILVRHQVWTRELVQSDRDPEAFGMAAREALRQTPDVVVPGETRAQEAGAILSLASSGHAVLTTIHAGNCGGAVERFAACAAMPGAYMFAGRRDETLPLTCESFAVVIHVVRSGGMRRIAEIALTDGVSEGTGGRSVPRLITLVRSSPGSSGHLEWQSSAVVRDGELEWHGPGELPAALALRLREMGATAPVRATATSRSATEEAIERAEAAATTGQSERALASLRRAWADRRDWRLVESAGRCLGFDARLANTLAGEARVLADACTQALQRRSRTEARAAYERTEADPALLAAFTPPGGWQGLIRLIEAAEERDRRAVATTASARLALAQGRERDAADLLRDLDPASLDPAIASEALQVREQAVAYLVERGEVSASVLEQIRAQRGV